MSNSFELEHSGVKGRSGRYPWGSGDRPYQRLEGSRKSPIGRMKANKAKKQAKAAEQREKYLEENKDRVLRSGTAKEVSEYAGRLTVSELNQVYQRLNLEANIKNLSERDKMKYSSKLTNLAKKIDKGSEYISSGIKYYNAFARIYNSTPAGKESPLMPIPIGTKKKK